MNINHEQVCERCGVCKNDHTYRRNGSCPLFKPTPDSEPEKDLIEDDFDYPQFKPLTPPDPILTNGKIGSISDKVTQTPVELFEGANSMVAPTGMENLQTPVELPPLDESIRNDIAATNTMTSAADWRYIENDIRSCRERQLLSEIAAKRDAQKSTEYFRQSMYQLEQRVLELKKERDDAIADLEHVRSDSDGAYQKLWVERNQLQHDLDAMTEDRDLWQDEHNDDCPYLLERDQLQRDLDAAREKIRSLVSLL